MSISSSFFGSGIVVLNQSNTNSFCNGGGGGIPMWRKATGTVTVPATEERNGLVIECSSRPQKKATAHHRKTRPKKSQPWDIKRGPTVYAPLPPLPPEWTLFSAASATETTTTESDPPPPTSDANN